MRRPDAPAPSDACAALGGKLFALRASDGKQLWSFQARFQLAAPNGSTVQGGTLDSVGAFAVDDIVLLNSGYNPFGGRNLVNARPGNALFVFELADSSGVDN